MSPFWNTLGNAFKVLLGPLIKALTYFAIYRAGKKDVELDAINKEIKKTSKVLRAKAKVSNIPLADKKKFWKGGNKDA